MLPVRGTASGSCEHAAWLAPAEARCSYMLLQATCATHPPPRHAPVACRTVASWPCAFQSWRSATPTPSLSKSSPLVGGPGAGGRGWRMGHGAAACRGAAGWPDVTALFLGLPLLSVHPPSERPCKLGDTTEWPAYPDPPPHTPTYRLHTQLPGREPAHSAAVQGHQVCAAHRGPAAVWGPEHQPGAGGRAARAAAIGRRPGRAVGQAWRSTELAPRQGGWPRPASTSTRPALAASKSLRP